MEDKSKKSSTMKMQEDTAGNKHYSEFEEGSTAPVRTLVEKPDPKYSWESTLPEYHSQR